MTNNFRALCAEPLAQEAYVAFVQICKGGSDDAGTYDADEAIVRRALKRLHELESAALADEPAVLDDREPAAVAGQPSDEELWELYRGPGTFSPIEYARAVLARWGSPAPAPPADVSQLSDGYHTFAELYEHRYSLMLALMRALPRICWFSRRHADGELPFGSDDWFIVGAELPGAPITYHLPAALYSLAQKTGALELPAGRPWDGHLAADVVHRLRDWAIEPAPPADGEVAELTGQLIEAANGAAAMGWDQHAQRILRAAELLERLSSPQPPADGEVAELVAWLREQLHVCLQAPWTPGVKHFGRAAELLERQALVPVAVSERLPEPSDCAPWPDEPAASAWCWVGSDVDGGWSWEQRSAGCLAAFPDDFTHWLPAHALPLPEVGE